MTFFSSDQINKIKQIAIEAGVIATNFFVNRKLQITKKLDGSDVTNADIAVSKFIKNHLLELFPSIPIICEEGCNRTADDKFFLIDPIDGTSSFIKGSDQFTINIALINDKKPVFGLINAPVFDNGRMAFTNSENKVIFYKNGKEFHMPDKQMPNKQIKLQNIVPRIVTSKRTEVKELLHYFGDEKLTIERISSSLKFIHLLENKADFYIHLRQTMEWDTAAGQALIEAANGKVLKLSANLQLELSQFHHLDPNNFINYDELRYGKKDFINSTFISFVA